MEWSQKFWLQKCGHEKVGHEWMWSEKIGQWMWSQKGWSQMDMVMKRLVMNNSPMKILGNSWLHELDGETYRWVTSCGTMVLTWYPCSFITIVNVRPPVI